MSIAFSQMPFVLLCCQGRSGSTLLLRHLNSIDGYHIMGENRGAIQQLLHFYKNIKHIDNVRSTVAEEHYKLAWNNTFEYPLVLNSVYNIFRDLFWDPEKRVFGFKEISFGFDNYEKFEEELNLLKELFPNLKIVFLTRDINELIKSSWWAENEEKSKKILLKQEINFKKYYKEYSIQLENNAPFIYYLTYTDLSKKTDKFLKLYDFIEEDFDEQRFLDISNKVTS